MARPALAASQLADEQDRLRIVLDSARDFLKRGWSIKEFRTLIDSPDGYSDFLWQQACRLGFVNSSLELAGSKSKLASYIDKGHVNLTGIGSDDHTFK